MPVFANPDGNMTVPWKDWIPGALTKIQVKALVQDGCIENAQASAIDYSSFDLTLDDKGWEMVRGSVKPFGGGSNPSAHSCTMSSNSALWSRV